ncbi:MAG: hypothetical protein HYX63_08715 [Gammaproteobacteria bacterium]|nr:hypothetical protein [Gammaproteobacteria bacterium]
MAAGVLRSWLDGRRADVLWLEYEAYARRVFANAPSDWSRVVSRYANTMVQARKALPTDVLTFDLAAAGMAALGDSEVGVARVRAALSAPSGRAFIAEAVDAVAHKIGDSTDLVLKVATPLDLWMSAAPDASPSFDELDEIATAITNLLRDLSDKPLAGVLLTRASAVALSLDESDAYAPILNAARHYRWITCMSLHPGVIGTPTAHPVDVDILLGPDIPLSTIGNLPSTTARIGGGLDAAFWSSNESSFEHAAGELRYGIVPDDLEPEQVLARMAVLTR